MILILTVVIVLAMGIYMEVQEVIRETSGVLVRKLRKGFGGGEEEGEGDDDDGVANRDRRAVRPDTTSRGGSVSRGEEVEPPLVMKPSRHRGGRAPALSHMPSHHSSRALSPQPSRVAPQPHQPPARLVSQESRKIPQREVTSPRSAKMDVVRRPDRTFQDV